MANTLKLSFIVCYKSTYIRVIIIYFIAFAIFSFVHYGQDRTNVLFLETSPLCLDNVVIGVWLFLQGSLMAIGMIVLAYFGSCWFDDSGMAYIGIFSRTAGSLCLAFARNIYGAFSGKLSHSTSTVQVLYLTLHIDLCAVKYSLGDATTTLKHGDEACLHIWNLTYNLSHI